MLTLNSISYIHTNGDVLFDNINLTINSQSKISIVGNNGSGKSTLLKIVAGELFPSAGKIQTISKPYYVPQHSGQFNDFTVAQALQVENKLGALTEITNGNVTEANLTLLNEDWLIEERSKESLIKWDLADLDLNRKMKTLSGGQKTKVFLSGIAIHHPHIILLDEPSNHLDTVSRNLLYNYIETTSNALIVVSHDKTLLNLLPITYELSKRGLTLYGGNYDFYSEQKKMELNALNHNLESKEAALRKAKKTERESMERKQKEDARGKKKQEKAGLPRISMNTFKNNAENSTSRIKDVHAEKIESIALELNQIRKSLLVAANMKLDLNQARLHHGKRLIEATNINFGYNEQLLWTQPLSFLITSGERIVLKGNNGSGKTTLIRILLGTTQPMTGIIKRADVSSVYVDQDYSLIDTRYTVYEQVQQFNMDHLPEHELKIRLNRFLFTKEDWDKPCMLLSGGEKMRLVLCCLMIRNQAPDLILLDEPTNNIDIQNTEILTAAISDYKGTLVVVSHDNNFLKQMNIEREIRLY
jgi:ATPase subunit of ABC transporter with duplicated ATPase domains